MGEVVTRLCFCRDREAAMQAGTFIREYEGTWIFPLDPVRAMSPRARYFAFVEREDHPHEDHSGEPYRRVTCPWCGLDLPGAITDPPPPAEFCSGDGPE